MTSNALEFLTKRARFASVKAQEVVVREGEPGDRMFVILNGGVRACRNFGEAGEKELARLGAGECFGEMCILDTQPRSATIQATVDSTLFSLNATVLYELYAQFPSQFSVMLLNIARELSNRLRQLDKDFAAFQ